MLGCRCSLCVVSCGLIGCLLFVGWCAVPAVLLVGVCGLSFVACCRWVSVCCLLCVVCCGLCVVCCWLCVVCCLVCVVVCLLFVCWLLFVGLFVDC